MARGVRVSGLVKTRARGKTASEDAKVTMLQSKLNELQAEHDHRAGLVVALQADRDRLRQRVLDAARGEVCSRCCEEARAAGIPAAPPAPPAQAQAPRSPSTTMAEPLAPAETARFDPHCHLCRAHVCNGAGARPCHLHGGVAPGSPQACP